MLHVWFPLSGNDKSKMLCTAACLYIQRGCFAEWSFNWGPSKYLHSNCQLLTSVIREYDANVLSLLHNHSAHQAAEWHLRGQEWLTAEERSRQSDQMAGAPEPAVLWLNTRGEYSRDKWWQWIIQAFRLYSKPKHNIIPKDPEPYTATHVSCFGNSFRMKWTRTLTLKVNAD